jgi:phosphoribosyl-AMP cyclohydrolase
MNPIPLLVAGTALAMAMMVVVWFFARRMNNAGIVDIWWSFGFAPVAVFYGIFGSGHMIRNGLIAAMAVDSVTREPLMLAYMNEESLRRTLEIGEAVYWSRSRKEYWHKGATSGHVQKIVEIRTDCDQDALVLVVEQVGAGACHTGRGSCFYRRVVKSADGTPGLEFTGGDRTFDPAAVYGKA